MSTLHPLEVRDPSRAEPVTADSDGGFEIRGEDRDEVMPRVSVVVPVYNPGPYIEPAIASILGQTMAAGEVEAIFVDDGSTDGTSTRLDRLAAEHPAAVRVIHIAPSGSPGRPRNLGIEAARGRYIQFLDADDELAPRALERLVAIADRNGSDIVVGKFASGSLPRSQRLFKRNVERCSLDDMPVLVDSSLGPTKLFRRAFLLDQAIVFPEGWRIMEDQFFSLQAYLRARVISILAEHPCYYFHGRDDGSNLSFQPIDPDRHFADLRLIVDMVVAETEPGALRDRILRRLLRAEVLNRLGELSYPDLPEADRARLFAGAHELLIDAFDPDVEAGLGVIGRIRSELLREDRPAQLLALVEGLRDLGLSATFERARWRAGKLQVGAAAGLVFLSSGRPFVVVRRGEQSYLDPAIADALLGRPLAVTKDLERVVATIILRDRASALEWESTAPAVATTLLTSGTLPPSPTPEESTEVPVRLTVKAGIDPERVGAGALPVGAGTWDVLIRLDGLGLRRTAPLVAPHPDRLQAACRPALLGDPARIVVPIVGATGLRLEVDPPALVLAEALAGERVRVVRDGHRVVLELAMAGGPGVAPLPVELVVRGPGADRILAAQLRVRFDGVALEAAVSGVDDLIGGPYPILLRLGGANDGAEVALGMAEVVGRSRLRFLDLERLTASERIGAAGRSGMSGSVRSVVARGRSLYRRLPVRARRSMRGIARRVR